MNDEAIARPILSDQPHGEILTNAATFSLDMSWPQDPESLHHWPKDLNAEEFDEIINSTGFDAQEEYIITGEIYTERVQFVSRQFQKYPESFYKLGQTSFIHRHLSSEYASPIIYDCLSACALYCGKNEANKTLVFSDISRKAWGLARQQTPTSVLYSCWPSHKHY
jgi:hypothetical protein